MLIKGNTKGACGPSLVAPLVKHLPARQETQVPSLEWEDPLGKGMATHSSILAWRIPWPWRAMVYSVAKNRTQLKQPLRHVLRKIEHVIIGSILPLEIKFSII